MGKNCSYTPRGQPSCRRAAGTIVDLPFDISKTAVDFQIEREGYLACNPYEVGGPDTVAVCIKWARQDWPDPARLALHGSSVTSTACVMPSSVATAQFYGTWNRRTRAGIVLKVSTTRSDPKLIV